MSNITHLQFTRLVKARHLQIERYRTEYFKQHNENPSAGEPEMDRSRLFVKLRDDAFILPISIMEKWAKTFGEETPISFDYVRGLATIVLKRNTSTLRTYIYGPDYDAQGNAFLRNEKRGYGAVYKLDKPIELKESIGTPNYLTVEDIDIEGELAKLKAQSKDNRKVEARNKAIAKANSALKEAKARLAEATESAEKAQAIIDGQTLKQAIAYSRACLKARRLYRATLDNPSLLKKWALPTFERAESYNHDTGKAVYVERDTVVEFQDYVNALAMAEMNLSAYKPRTLRVRRYV